MNKLNAGWKWLTKVVAKQEKAPRLERRLLRCEGLEERTLLTADVANALGLAATERIALTADYDADGYLDEVIVDETAGQIRLRSQNPEVTEAPAALLADLNRDGRIDIVVAGPGSNSVFFYLNQGGNNYSEQSLAVDVAPTSLAVGDLDGDGVSDLAVGNHDASDIYLWLGQGSQDSFTFTPGATQTIAAGVLGLTFSDSDGDGIEELIVTGCDATTSVFSGFDFGVGSSSTFDSGSWSDFPEFPDFSGFPEFETIFGDPLPDLLLPDFGEIEIPEFNLPDEIVIELPSTPAPGEDLELPSIPDLLFSDSVGGVLISGPSSAPLNVTGDFTTDVGEDGDLGVDGLVLAENDANEASGTVEDATLGVVLQTATSEAIRNGNPENERRIPRGRSDGNESNEGVLLEFFGFRETSEVVPPETELPQAELEQQKESQPGLPFSLSNPDEKSAEKSEPKEDQIQEPKPGVADPSQHATPQDHDSLERGVRGLEGAPSDLQALHSLPDDVDATADLQRLVHNVLALVERNSAATLENAQPDADTAEVNEGTVEFLIAMRERGVVVSRSEDEQTAEIAAESPPCDVRLLEEREPTGTANVAQSEEATERNPLALLLSVPLVTALFASGAFQPQTRSTDKKSEMPLL